MDTAHDFDLRTEKDDWKDMVGKDWQVYRLKPVYSTSFVPVFFVDATEPTADELVKRWNAHSKLLDFVRMVKAGNTELDQLESEADNLLIEL